MPASAETEPVEVKYGTNSCNAVFYNDLYFWAKPFTLNLYVGTNMKSVAASVKDRITGLDNPAPSGSSTSQLTLGTKWHDTISIDCTPKDPVYNYQTTISITAATRVAGPYPETQNYTYQTITIATAFVGSGDDIVTKSETSSIEHNQFYYDLNGGDLRNGLPLNEPGNGRETVTKKEEHTPYEDWDYTRQQQEKHQYRNRYENQKQKTETTSERTVTTTYSFAKWTFHGTSSQASGVKNTIISNLAMNINYDAVGKVDTIVPKWTPISVVTHDWTTTSTYYNPNWTWTGWTDVGNPYVERSHEKVGPTTTVYVTHTYDWQPARIHTAIPIRYCYSFDYWNEHTTSGAAYSPGATYNYTTPYIDDEVDFYAHWSENPHIDNTSYSRYVEDYEDYLKVYIKNKRSGYSWFNTIIPTRFRFYTDGGGLLYDCRPHGWSSGSSMPIHGGSSRTIDWFDSISGSWDDAARANYCLVDYDYTDGGGWGPTGSKQCIIRHDHY